jgi:cobalt/nickel transport protein
MNKGLHGWIWIGMGISILLALFLSPFASSSPDGLEKVAEMKGFNEKGEGWKFWKHAPLPDYALPWIKNEKVSTALSGLLGTLAIFLIALGLGKLLRRSSGKKRLSLLLFSLSLPFYVPSLYAARPLTTDDAWTVERGKFQVEMGLDFLRENNHDRGFIPLLHSLRSQARQPFIRADRNDLSIDRQLGMGFGSGNWHEQGRPGFSGDRRIDLSF